MLGLVEQVKAKILQTSTSAVYGDRPVHPQTEEYWAASIRSADEETVR
jgi:UDP-glucuronate decarboxylase